MTQPSSPSTTPRSNDIIRRSNNNKLLFWQTTTTTTTRDSNIRFMLTVVVLLGVPLFMVWWQVSGGGANSLVVTQQQQQHQQQQQQQQTATIGLFVPNNDKGKSKIGGGEVAVMEEQDATVQPVISDVSSSSSSRDDDDDDNLKQTINNNNQTTTTTTQQQQQQQQHHDHHLPSMVWLMSFPNSGTSYTMRLVMTASLRAVATNYGPEFTNPPIPSTPLYPPARGFSQQGPFWRGGGNSGNGNGGNNNNNSINYHPLPDKYIMTKTHCGGRCVRCPPRKYIMTQNQFTRACTEGSGCFLPTTTSDDELEHNENDHVNDDDDGDDGSSLSTNSTSSSSAASSSCVWRDTRYLAPPRNPYIAKMIHLIRDPFDNIVSRFHLARKLVRKRFVEGSKELQDWLDEHPDNATGFATWCSGLDRDYGSPFNDQKTEKILHASSTSLTCQGEWFKYVQWHTLTLGTIAKSRLPSLTIYYEDYEEPTWNQTVTKILDFLELEKRGQNIREFYSHPSYQYYTDQQRREARTLVKQLAPDPVWQLLSRYFDDDGL